MEIAMLWRLFFVLMFAVAVAACAAQWDIGKGNAEISRKGGD